MTAAAAAVAVLALLLLLAAASSGRAAEAPPQRAAAQIVLIGGAPGGASGIHAYPDGVRRLAALLKESPDAQAVSGLTAQAWPDGWPDDPMALDDAATMVWYFDGFDQHPLRDPARRAHFAASMRRGVRLVALHQASTIDPSGPVMDLPYWLGGLREGLYDRTTESTTLQASAVHPVGSGVAPFTYRGEFYPTLGLASSLRSAELGPGLESAAGPAVPAAVAAASPFDTLTFHRDPQRCGWNAQEAVLTPARVVGSEFGRLWDSPMFDTVDGPPPRVYALPGPARRQPTAPRSRSTLRRLPRRPARQYAVARPARLAAARARDPCPHKRFDAGAGRRPCELRRSTPSRLS